MQIDQRNVTFCLFRRHFLSCFAGGTAWLINAWASCKVAVQGPGFGIGRGAAGAALGEWSTAIPCWRVKGRDSGNNTVISLSSPAAGCAGLSHPKNAGLSGGPARPEHVQILPHCGDLAR